MALPAANITTTMVRNELGESTNNVGKLCTSPNINMWSKRKPVRDFRREVPYYEVGVGDKCGLEIPVWTGDDTKITTYRRPGTWVDKTGQHTSPLRLGDFRGYSHDTTAKPVTIGAKPTVIYKRSTQVSLYQAAPGSPIISLHDLGLWVGLLCYGKGSVGGTPVFVGAATGGGGSIPLELYGVSYAFLDIKFALFSESLQWTTTMPTIDKYELPRSYVGENQNWSNVPLELYFEYIQSFEIAGFRTAQQIQYTIRAGNRDVSCILRILKDSDNTIIFQKSNVNVTAGTTQSFTDNNVPLQAGVSYTVKLTSNLSGEPEITRPLFVG